MLRTDSLGRKIDFKNDSHHDLEHRNATVEDFGRGVGFNNTDVSDAEYSRSVIQKSSQQSVCT